MPSFLARENANQVPVAALWLTNIVIQTFLLVTYFAEYAFNLALKMTSSMTLIPYLLVAAYGLKLAWTGETYADDAHGRAIDWIRGAIATLYATGMIYAGGAKFLLLSTLLYAPGTWFAHAVAVAVSKGMPAERSTMKELFLQHRHN
jgi:arginine:ornithine antiporter/lysine permease